MPGIYRPCDTRTSHTLSGVESALVHLLHVLQAPFSLFNMKVFIVLAALFAIALSQVEVPIPYSFNYISNTEDGGSSSHEEAGDGAGKVTGSYSVTDLEGHNRVVEYVADDLGFRATIRTNEPGTANINPADVVMESSAPDAAAAPTFTSGATSGSVSPARPVAPRVTGARYVLVPITDARARGY